ncbi:WxL domain-containing protein [Enterococcus crotali]|uniref:WxL domain-containing protein n=1 Tax=Enterococcus crotali TaxID=1453587 RepID=UPI000471CFA8|nr:WxL domain-containing protein [Enterococcus crotali]
MKAIKTTACLALMVSATAIATPAFAEQASTAASKANVEIIAGDDTNEIIDPIDPPTGNKGPLVIDAVSSFDFGKIKLGTLTKDAEVPEGKQLGVQVTDKRGTGAGWTLLASITEFENADKTKTLKGSVKIPAGKVNTSASDSSKAAVASGITLNSTAATVFSAAKDNGMGSWSDLFEGNGQKVELSVPSDAYVAAYEATINWSLQDAPK